MAKTVLDQSMIHGEVAPGFEEVREEFIKNFTHRGELGAACAIYHKGEKVVDLWGGYRDYKNRTPWEEDTLVLVFSTTKGLASMTLAVAHSQGLLDYDERVAAYWPEFSQQGKENITVRQLLSHQAGLCVIDEPLDERILADFDLLASAAARQKPVWEHGTKHGYHGISLGWYQGELIRRVDPHHRSLGCFFQDEIARPLGLEFYIGLPPEIPVRRIASIESYTPLDLVLNLNRIPGQFAKSILNPRSLTARAFSNPRLKSPGDFNKPPFRSLEIPAGNGIGQVRSIAKAYGVFAAGGKEINIKKETMEELTAPATPPSSGWHDEVLHMDISYSLGFMKPLHSFKFGSSHKSFGTPGAGGSFGFADPQRQVGYAYAMTKMGFHIVDDPREKALRDAFYSCLDQLSI